jgi:hypothetical protein
MFLIQSFIDTGKTRQKRFAAGKLTIIDMSDPFIDAASACGIFEIVTRLFVRAQVDTGKVLVVDEAHKVSLCPTTSLTLILNRSIVPNPEEGHWIDVDTPHSGS